jgi:Streptomyces sporulation and cell division protein, SsgA
MQRLGHTMNRSGSVAAELGLRLVVPEHDGVPLTASLCYRGDDPYAIRMAFHAGLDDPVEWIFARDLLAAGLQTPVGEGDVRVWPGPRGLDMLNISLSSPFGQAHFETSLSALSGFLRLSFEVVPLGQEGDFIDIESELRGLHPPV